MADPKNNQRIDEDVIGKPHGEPDEIGKAHDPVEFDDEDNGDKVQSSASHPVHGGRGLDLGANAPEAEQPKQPKNPTK